MKLPDAASLNYPADSDFSSLIKEGKNTQLASQAERFYEIFQEIIFSKYIFLLIAIQ